MIWSLSALCVGFLIDLVLGDPHGVPHPVVLIGKLIGWVEKKARRIFPKTPAGETFAGALLWGIVAAVSTAVPYGILCGCRQISPYLRLAVESVMCWQILAVKSLKSESMKVYAALEKNDTEAARRAVSMIVGRDTARLDRDGITRAAIETVAENTSDGVIAPMLFIALFGAAGGFFYKAVNTMDSMLGYREAPYRYIGHVPARADDLANLIPSRLSALLMLLAGLLLRMDFKNGVRVFIRDRYRHASPNSAQTESVCAGLLRIRLAGDAWYHGVLHEKPYIGDDLRPVEYRDIKRACRLLYLTAALAMLPVLMEILLLV
jgi:adenosylcobinamide-phosphate synthase